MSKPKPLTPKQEAFVLAYIKTGNASEAYRQAYNTNASAKTIHEKASRLLAEGNVRARFEVLRGKVTERAVEKTAISKAWVIEKLVENVERAMQVEPVRRKTDEPVIRVSVQCPPDQLKRTHRAFSIRCGKRNARLQVKVVCGEIIGRSLD